jgi:hypothetical protein
MLRFVFNALAICGAASFAGAMIIIGLAFGGYWKSLPPAVFLDWFSQNGHLIGRVIPIFALPAAIGLLASLWMGWNGSHRGTWVVATVAMTIVGVITAIYHLPTNAGFVEKTIPLDAVSSTLATWLSLHWVRIAMALVSAVAAIYATVYERAT